MTDNIAQLEAELEALDAPNRRKADLTAQIENIRRETELDKARAILRQSQADYMAIRPGFEKARKDFEKAKATFQAAKEAWQAALDTEEDRYGALKICRQLARTAGLRPEEINQLGGGTGGGGNQ